MKSCMILPDRHRDRPITSAHGVLFVAMLINIFGTMPAAAQRAGSSVGSRLHATARYAASKRALAAGQGSTTPDPSSPRRRAPAVGPKALRVPLAAGSVRSSPSSAIGIVPGTDRGERLVTWPLGIESAGAMREWGGMPPRRLAAVNSMTRI
jgi:hypothetical protein